MPEFNVCHNWSTDFIFSELGLISITRTHSFMNIVVNKETAYFGILCLPSKFKICENVIVPVQ
jgi:hypothetical protein